MSREMAFQIRSPWSYAHYPTRRRKIFFSLSSLEWLILTSTYSPPTASSQMRLVQVIGLEGGSKGRHFQGSEKPSSGAMAQLTQQSPTHCFGWFPHHVEWLAVLDTGPLFARKSSDFSVCFYLLTHCGDLYQMDSSSSTPALAALWVPWATPCWVQTGAAGCWLCSGSPCRLQQHADGTVLGFGTARYCPPPVHWPKTSLVTPLGRQGCKPPLYKSPSSQVTGEIIIITASCL